MFANFGIGTLGVFPRLSRSSNPARGCLRAMLTSMTPDRAKAARELLGFYLEAGVEDLVREAPVDRFADAPDPPSALPPARESGLARPDLSRPPAPTPQFRGREGPPVAPRADGSAAALASSEAAVMAAREAAKSAQTLDELRAILARFEGCALRLTAKQLVFADGYPQARLMCVGEAPGREEDLEGLPFVGRSGQLLDRMLKAIGLDRTSVYIANIIPWRPPGNRDPTPQESTICLPFIRRQIELVDPDVLVCLGKPSSAALLGLTEGIRRTRGRWMPYHTGTREIRAMPTYHPAYLLRSPLEKRHAWRDFLAIKKALAE
jgi:uracil-DNA glycosylase